MKGLDASVSAELLVLDTPDDRQMWMDRLSAAAVESAFALPDFVEFWAGERADSAAALFSWEDSGGRAVLPLILRPLPALRSESGKWGLDAISPYGYGGPFWEGSPDWPRFWADLKREMRSRGILTFAVRLSPGLAAGALPAGSRVAGVTVIRGLGGFDADSLWMEYRHKVRKNVNRALRDGLTFELDAECSRLDDFHTVYSATMNRAEATDFYRFSRADLTRLVESVAPHCVLAHVLSEGEVVSTELVLLERGRAYSFLGGTLASAFDSRPNDLLKHRVIEWCLAEGRGEFILGGGVSASDGIVRYKKAFAPEGVVDFHLGRLVADVEAYTGAVDSAGVADSDFFPAYRSAADR